MFLQLGSRKGKWADASKCCMRLNLRGHDGLTTCQERRLPLNQVECVMMPQTGEEPG